MTVAEFKIERELLYNRAIKLYQSATREDRGIKETAQRQYKAFVFKNQLSEEVVLKAAKWLENNKGREFKIKGMSTINFKEFFRFFNLNKDTESVAQRIRAVSIIFKN